MAGQIKSSTNDASPAGFGLWLRELRERKEALMRTMAAAADMDPSHLGKVERGERLPTANQITAFAKYLAVPEAEMRSRYVAAKLWMECDGDAAIAVGVAELIHEHAAAYVVNNRANKK